MRTRSSRKVKVVNIASEETGLLERRRQKDCDCGGPEWANPPPVLARGDAGQSSDAGLMGSGSCLLHSHLDLSARVS